MTLKKPGVAIDWRLAACAAIVLSPSAATAAPAQTAAQFVTSVYSHYPAPEGATWDTLGDSAPQVFEADMVALIRKAQDTATSDDDNPVGVDVLCQCQDETGIRWRVGTAVVVSPTESRVPVTVRFPAIPQDTPIRVTLDVRLGAQGWRVHDLSEPGMTSFRAYLVQHTRRHPS
jgi:hypothetical protein